MMIGVCLANFMKKTLIVVPPILIDQWYDQILKTTGHKSLIYHGANKKYFDIDILNNSVIVITTYSTLNSILLNIKWSRVIYDEAHHLRNDNMRSCCSRFIRANIRWLVSGTPIQNKKKDFYNLCQILKMPTSYYTDNNNLPEIARCFIMKRTKKQVGINLPDMMVDNIQVNWKNNNEMMLSKVIHSVLNFGPINLNYNNHFSNFIKRYFPLIMFLRARQSAILPKLLKRWFDKLIDNGCIPDYCDFEEAFDCSSKLDSVIDAIYANKDNGNGKIVFCHYHEEMDEIAMRLRNIGFTNVAIFDGRKIGTARSKILAEKNDVLILQINTGCEGLNLQENYSEIYFVSPNWNPCVEEQAVARCHRIGQTKTVFVKRFEMSGFVNNTNDTTNDTTNDKLKIIKDIKDIKNNSPNGSGITIEKYVNLVQNNKREIINQILNN
jgi:SNF2 family DNA or RNA helicase